MTISEFKRKTKELFQPINNMTSDDIEQFTECYIQEHINNISINSIILSGSRCRGKEQNNSDIDIILYYNGDEKEDHLFNILHSEDIRIDGIPIDINPISSKTTDIEHYLDNVEIYLTANKEVIDNDHR